MVIPQQCHHMNPETRLFSTSAPEIEAPVEWFQVKSKKEKSLEKRMQRKKQSELNDESSKQPKTESKAEKKANNKENSLQPPQALTTVPTSRLDTREELDFMFDEEIPSTHIGNTYNASNINDSFSDSDSDDSDYDYEYDYDDLDDQTISKLVIITQTPPSSSTNIVTASTGGSTATRKHGGIDRTGDFLPRSKITADLARAINDGLYYYEQDLKKKTSSKGPFEKTSIVSNEQFSKLKGLESSNGGSTSKKTANAAPNPPSIPPPLTDKMSKVTPITIQKLPQQYQQHYAFIPHSLPNDSTLMPSLRQLMSHVNAIKSGTIEGKHARAASNAAGVGGGVLGREETSTRRTRNNSGSYRINQSKVTSKFGCQREKVYSSKKTEFLYFLKIFQNKSLRNFHRISIEKALYIVL